MQCLLYSFLPPFSHYPPPDPLPLLLKAQSLLTLLSFVFAIEGDDLTLALDPNKPTMDVAHIQFSWRFPHAPLPCEWCGLA